MKPTSIKRFDLLYLGALVVSVIGMIINFDAMVEISDQTLTAQGLEPMGGNILLVAYIVGIVFLLVIWFLISVLRVEMIKWLLVLFVVYNIITMIAAIKQNPMSAVIAGSLVILIQALVVYFLFKPDAKAWFAEKRNRNN